MKAGVFLLGCQFLNQSYEKRNKDSMACNIYSEVLMVSGKYYLKLGHGVLDHDYLHTAEDIRTWYCRTPQTDGKYEHWLMQKIKSYFPSKLNILVY